MFTARILTTSALLMALTACGSTYTSVSNKGVTLASSTAEDGSSLNYRLLPGNGSAPKILRTRTSKREKAVLDTKVSSLTSELAEKLGVQPWNGVYVKRTKKGSAASKAGLIDGDIIVSMDGTTFSSQQQFDELLPSQLQAGKALDLVLLRNTGESGAESSGRETLNISLTPDTKQVTEKKTDSIELETSKGVQELTGAQIATVPPDLAGEIYGVNEPVAVVSGVIAGSPAYLSGLRKGDRILEVDGQKIDSVRVVRDLVRSRATYMNLPLESLGLANADAGSATPAPTGESLSISVDGPLGPHTSSVKVTEGMSESSSFYFPILFDYDSSVSHTDWSFLDFIFQFGANYDSRYLHSSTRAPAVASKLSMLPLGMFEFESTPTFNEYTFLWLITWKTRN